MSAMQQLTANHQSETFSSGQTQFFECEALSAGHPEIQARECARQQRLQLSNPSEKLTLPHPGQRSGKDQAPLTFPCQSICVLLSSLTFGSTEEAGLDVGTIWPTAFPLK